MVWRQETISTPVSPQKLTFVFQRSFQLRGLQFHQARSKNLKDDCSMRFSVVRLLFTDVVPNAAAIRFSFTHMILSCANGRTSQRSHCAWG